METQAVSLTYTLIGGSILANTDTDNGLNILTSVAGSLPGYTFTLDDGEYETFQFFKIWTDEGSVNFGEDTTPKQIAATLNFDTGFDATVNGVTFGQNLLLTHSGKVQWGDPVEFVLADRTFVIDLKDETFNKGGLLSFGLKAGERNGTWVKATIKQKDSRLIEVPETASTLVLLGVGIAGLLSFKRRMSW